MQIYRGENDVYKFMEKMVEEVDIIIARKQRRNISISHEKCQLKMNKN